MDSVVFQNRWKAVGLSSDAVEMRSLARDIGFALPQMNAASLRAFLNEFGPDAEATESDVARAFRTTAVEIVASCESALAALEAERSAESLVLHEGWRRILNELAKGPAGPSNLAEALGVDKSYVSRALSAMRGADLVEVSRSTSAKQRPHRLTAQGDRLVRRLSQEHEQPEGWMRDAERTEVLDLASRSLTSLSFKTARELTFYVALIYLAVEVTASDEGRQTGDHATLREIRRLMVDIPTGVYVPTNFTPKGEIQQVLALLRARLRDTTSNASFQRTLRGVGQGLDPDSSTALVWACVAADFTESHMHERHFAGELRSLALAILKHHHTPLAIWCRSKVEQTTDVSLRSTQMKSASVKGKGEMPRVMLRQLEETKDVEFFDRDPNAGSLPLSEGPRRGIAQQFLKSREAKTIEAISIVGADGWLSDPSYLEANCEAASKIRRLIIADDPAKLREQRKNLDILHGRKVELRVLSRQQAQHYSGQWEIENLLIWNRRYMTTSRDNGELTDDSRAINTALESWQRMWDNAQPYAPSNPGSEGEQAPTWT